MAVGVGVDIIEVKRVEEVIRKRGERFLERVFTPHEIAYCRQRRHPWPSFAARFAAKEAALKALGTGWARGVTWKDVEVFRISGDPPRIRLRGKALQIVCPFEEVLPLCEVLDPAGLAFLINNVPDAIVLDDLFAQFCRRFGSVD